MTLPSFIVLVNTKTPESTDSIRLKESLEERYGVPAYLADVTKLTQESLCEIMGKILMEFPVLKINLRLPKWMRSLPFDGKIISDCVQSVKEKCAEITKMSDCNNLDVIFENNDLFVSTDTNYNLSNGCVDIKATPDERVYYKVLSEETGREISDDYSLMQFVRVLAKSYQEYEGIRVAMESVKEDGYGIGADDSGICEV